jgi:hypothetical protein
MLNVRPWLDEKHPWYTRVAYWRLLRCEMGIGSAAAREAPNQAVAAATVMDDTDFMMKVMMAEAAKQMAMTVGFSMGEALCFSRASVVGKTPDAMGWFSSGFPSLDYSTSSSTKKRIDGIR